MDKLFSFCAVFGSIFVVLQFVFLMFGVGGDADADAPDVGSDSDSSYDSSGSHFLRLFSTRAVTAAIAFFGLAGLAALSAGLSPIIQVVCAITCGFIAGFVVYWIVSSLSKFNSDCSIKTSSAIGAAGSVYLTIPARRSGIGKVTILQQGRSMEYEASTDSETPLKSGTPIVVVEALTESQLLVKAQ